MKLVLAGVRSCEGAKYGRAKIVARAWQELNVD